MTSEREAVANTVERLIDEVSGWEHITVGDHRFGGTEFRVIVIIVAMYRDAPTPGSA